MPAKITVTALLSAAEAKLAELEAEAAHRLALENEEKAEAARTKQPIGDGGWKPRYQAELRRDAMLAVRDALQSTLDDPA